MTGYSKSSGKTSSRKITFFVPGGGIDREVISTDICRYLGNDATVKPGAHTDTETGGVTNGFYVTAYRALTTEQLSDLKADSARWNAERQRSSSSRGQSSGGISPRASDTVVRRSNVQPDGYARSTTRKNQQWNASDQREYPAQVMPQQQQQPLRQQPQPFYQEPSSQWNPSQVGPSYTENSNYEIAGRYAVSGAGQRPPYGTEQTYPSESGRGAPMQGYPPQSQPSMYYPSGGQRSTAQQAILNPGYGTAQGTSADFTGSRAPQTDVKDEDMEDYEFDDQDYPAPAPQQQQQPVSRTRQEPSYRDQESPREAPRERDRRHHRQHRS